MTQPASIVGIPITRTGARVVPQQHSPLHVLRLHASPARVHLGATNRSTLIALTNRGVERMQLQVRACAWDESPSGQVTLTPSDDLTVLPMVLTLAPGETRRVRVGFGHDTPDMELSYRVIVEEVDGPSASSRPRTSIPVFVQPRDGMPEPTIRDVRLDGAKLTFVLANAGRRYFKACALRVVMSPEGLPRDETLIEAYVLAGHARRFTVDVPPDARVQSAIIQVETESAGTIERAVTRRGVDVQP